MPIQTRSRSNKDVADAKLEKTSLSADVFIRSVQAYSSAGDCILQRRVMPKLRRRELYGELR